MTDTRVEYVVKSPHAYPIPELPNGDGFMVWMFGPKDTLPSTRDLRDAFVRRFGVEPENVMFCHNLRTGQTGFALGPEPKEGNDETDS